MSSGSTVKKNKKKQPPNRPIGPIYRTATRLFLAYLKLFRGLRIDNTAIKGLKGPYLVIANHQSFVDFGSVAGCCLPNRINFVVSSHYFHSPLLSKLFPLVGCISKKQFAPDLSAARQMLRVIKRGDCVGIFPEGQTCWSGQNPEIEPGIGKLAKTLKVPVVNIKIRGNYLTQPKWATGGSAPSKSEAKAEILLTADDVASMDASDITARIVSALSYDEYEWQRTALAASRKRSPAGLHIYLFKCPCCGQEFTIVSDEKSLRCTHCGMEVTMDEYGFLHSDSFDIFDTPSAWIRWQEQQLSEQLDAGTLLPITEHVHLLESAIGDYEEDGYRCTGEGDVLFNEEGMLYTGTRNGEPFEYMVSPKFQWNLTHSAKLCSIDICWDRPEDRDLGFDPDNPQMMIKIIQSWPLVRKKYHEQLNS